MFAAAFASTILTFFIRALLFNYQVERIEAKRHEQFGRLLVAELTGISEGLDRANAIKINISDGSAAEVVFTHLQPIFFQEAVREGFFGSERMERALRLVRNMST